MKVPGGVLQLTIVVGLLIALLCSSMILLSGMERRFQIQSEDAHRLLGLQEDGAALALSMDTATFRDNYYETSGRDSLAVISSFWGCYPLLSIHAYAGRDSLNKMVFTAFAEYDSIRVLTLLDEDRPVSVSGKTVIRGDAYLPKSGIKAAYVDGKGYTGNKKIVLGKIKRSEMFLPLPDTTALHRSFRYLDSAYRSQASKRWESSIDGDSLVERSFSAPVLAHYQHGEISIKKGDFRGHILFVSDSLIRVSRKVKMSGCVLIAPEIQIDSGFHGTLQAFSSKEIRIGTKVILDYPSALVLHKDSSGVVDAMAQIDLGADSHFEGTIVATDGSPSVLKTQIKMRKGSSIIGDAYVEGYLMHEGKNSISGTLSCRRFLYMSEASVYENYIVDMTLDRKAGSSYLLTPLRYKNTRRKEVLCWLK